MLAEPDVDRAVVAAAIRPIAAPLERCAEFLGVDGATVRDAAATSSPYVRVDGTKVWSPCNSSGGFAPTPPAGCAAATSPANGHRPQATDA
jgi:hypothetical protein